MLQLLDVIFTQSDDGFDLPPHDTLYNVEGVVRHGASIESIARVAEYLAQWDTDMLDPTRVQGALEPCDDAWVVRPTAWYDKQPWEVYDYVELNQCREGDYVLAGTRGAFASVALYRVVTS